MSISSRNVPLSPISLGGSDWTSSKYDSVDAASGPIPNGRGNLISPPNSGGSPGTMSMNGFPSGPRSNGGPSPPPSVGRSSNGATLYSGRRDSARSTSTRTEVDDSILYEHYIALRAFLTARDPNLRQPPNKARDKLLRLSAVQFYELSTDVFDELMRRQATARAPPNAPNGPPTFLLPEKNFHPKRNQARQRLSSLGPPRFRDLAADVFHELERRFPRFLAGDIPRVGSSMSMRSGPNSRTGTPVNGNGFGLRGPPRMRRPSDAGSLRGPPPPDVYGMPPSPGLPPGDFGRPMQKQLHQNNTIVPNKSTMVEEDDDGTDSDAFGLEGAAGVAKTGIAMSEADKRLMDDYQDQIKDLKEKMESMEVDMKRREDEMSAAMDGERSRASAANMQKKEWDDARLALEDKLAEAQTLNTSMKSELDRLREDHNEETEQLRHQLAEMQSHARAPGSEMADAELQRENEELRDSLQQQQETTHQVRTDAQEFLREMRMLSEQSSSTYEKQLELEKTVEQLEADVKEWRNRYTRTKTQLRSMRASSMGLPVDHDLARHVREKGFMNDAGLIKDVHVTKFQVAIDELLQRARKEDPDKVIGAMKSVVVSVRRIMKDMDDSRPQDEPSAAAHGKLKGRVSTMANALITASKNFSSAAGIFPISLLDAAASHLSASVVDLLRVVKIRATPVGEFDDEEDGTVTPGESAGFFSPRSTTQVSVVRESLPPPPPFQGLAGVRASATSSAYSPVSSPRESVVASRRVTNNTNRGMSYLGQKTSSAAPNGYIMSHYDSNAADLKLYLDDQTALLVSDIQNLVGSIRGDSDIRRITGEIGSINAIVNKIISETVSNGFPELAQRLDDSRERLLEANERGQDLANAGIQVDDRDWRMWTQILPPIAFEIARETKELVQRVDGMAMGHGDDFS